MDCCDVIIVLELSPVGLGASFDKPDGILPKLLQWLNGLGYLVHSWLFENMSLEIVRIKN